MKKLRKRVFSLLLACVMAFSLLPVTAWAVSPPTNESLPDEVKELISELKADGYEIAGSGYYQLGSSDLYQIRYTKNIIDDQGFSSSDNVYIIVPGTEASSNNCAIPDYTAAGDTPWNGVADRVYIAEGVTGIGNYAFYDQSSLEEVTIPSTVTSIGNYAFANNRAMTVRPATDSETGKTYVDLTHVTSIGEGAFQNCTSLASDAVDSTRFGGGLISVGASAFSGARPGELLFESDDTNRTLTIGNSAFSGASVGSVTFEDLGAGSIMTIGEHAFSSNGLTALDLPEGLTEIGAYGFSGNRLEGILTLPDSLTSIGAYAFYVSTDSQNETLTELNLGTELQFVGEHAFCNYIGLATINVSTTHTNLELGEAAFGHDATDACTTGQIQDSSGVWLATGTTINIIGDVRPVDRETIAKIFQNGKNCYTGEVSPLALVDTIEATCLTNGTNTYHYYQSGETEPRTFYEPIEHLGHDWVPADQATIGASCEQPGGTLWVCSNASSLITEGKDVTVPDTDGQQVTVLASGGHYRFDYSDDPQDAETGHNYRPSSARKPTIDGTGTSDTTTLVYACNNENHVNSTDADFNSYGGVVPADLRPKNASFIINWREINVNTLTTLSEIESQFAGMVANSAGSLTIVKNPNQTANSTLDAGERTLTILFTPSNTYLENFTGMQASSEFGGQTLQLKVNVNKIDLDFTNVYFQNTSTTTSNSGSYVYTNIAPGTSLPEGAEKPEFSYFVDGNWQETPPSRSEKNTYLVRATIKYDSDIYQVTNTEHTDSAYAIDASTEGEVTITTDYVVRLASLEGIEVSAPTVTFDGTTQNRVHLSGVPEGSIIVYSVTNEDGESVIEETTITVDGDNYEETATVDIANIKDSGIYTVAIQVTNRHYDGEYDRPVNFTINKKPVAIPNGFSLTYDPAKEQQGVPTSADGSYTLDKETCYAQNAGNYQGTVTLADADNTCWTGGSSEPIQVSYTIDPLQVTVPTVIAGFTGNYTYNGMEHIAVQSPTAADFSYSYEDGVLVGTYHGYKVFTVSDAKHTDADTYHSVASLNNPATGSPNYIWFNTQNGNDQTLIQSWIIRAALYTLPEITVGGDNSVEYTGKALDESLIAIGNSNPDDYTMNLVDGDVLTVSGYTWLDSSGSSVPGEVPINVGRYQLRVTFALSGGAVRSNYRFTGGDPSANTADGAITKTIPVEITKATLTLQAENDGTKTAVYTGSPITMPEVTIGDGLLVDGEEVELTYRYTPTDDNPDDGIAPQEQVQNKPFSFENVGTYTVSVEPAQSSNYTAASVEVILKITQATQDVRLTADDNTTLDGNAEDGYTVIKDLDDGSFFVTGAGYIDNTEPTEDHDTNANISYRVSSQTPEGQRVATVTQTGPGAGQVTIRGAGTAVITVTAAADTTSGYGNYTPGSASYTLTVNEGTPTITLSGTTFEAKYTGSPITGYEDLAELSGVSGIVPSGDLIYTFYDDPGCADEDEVDNGLTGGGVNPNIPIDVGTYYLKVTYDGENDPNYTNASAAQTITVTITPADVSGVTVTDYEDTYDGETHNMGEVMVNVPDSFEKGSYTIQFAERATQPDANAGDNVWKNASEITFRNVSDSTNENTGVHYWYMVTFDGDNYAPVIGEVNVTISPATLTLSSTLPSKEQLTRPYDGTVELPTGQAPTDTSRGLLTDDGKIAVTAAYADKNADKNAADSKDVVVTYTITFENGKAGNYTVGGSKTEDTNSDGKTVWTVTETVEGAGRITQKEITVTGGIIATKRVYDGTVNVDLSGTPQVEDGVFVETDDVEFETITTETGTVAKANADDEEKLVTVTAETLNSLLTGTDAGNYTVSANYTGTTVTISQRPVYLLFPNQTSQDTPWSTQVAYDPDGLTSQRGTYAVHAQDAGEDSGFVGIDNVSLAEGDIDYTFSDSSGEVSNPTNLGTYTVTAALSDKAEGKFSNYKIEPVEGEITIIQNNDDLTVNINWRDDLAYTGQGQDPIQSITVTGGNESLTEGAGGYTIAFSLENDSTYEITSEDDLEDAIVNAGTYTIYWQVTTTNYGTTTGNRKITVDRAELALTSSVTTTKTYDGTNDTEGQVTLGANALTGQQNGEQIEVSITSAVYDDATADNDKRITITYALEAAEGVLDNYKVSINGEEAVDAAATMPETVDATITPALVTVTIYDQTAVYDGETPEVSEVKEGNWKLTKGEIYQLTSGTDDDLGITLSIPRDAKDAGTYAISGDWENTNYDVTFQSKDGAKNHGTYTITPRPVNVTIDNASGVYGDDHGTAVDNSVSNLLRAEEPNVGENRGLAPNESLEDIGKILLDTDADIDSGVNGSYSIYAVSVAGGNKITEPTQYGNYMVTFVKGNATFTVNPRPITITIANKESAYGCTRQDLTWEDSYTGDSSKDGIVNDDDLGIDLTTTASSTSDVDDYPITGTTTAGSDVTGNYYISWAGSWNGEDDKKGIAGTYTIERADVSLDIQEDTLRVGFGENRQINISFTNKSSRNVIDDEDDIVALMDALQFSGGSGYTIDVQGGTVTVTVTDNNVLQRVKATLKETPNFHADTKGDDFVLIGVQGQLNVQVFPVQGLSYTGEDLALVYPYYGDEELPDGVTIQYTQDQTDEASWSENIPTGKNADQYTVYWRIYDPTGTYAGSGVVHTVFSSISEANLTAEFQEPTDDVLLSAGTYNIEAENSLTLSPDTGYDRSRITYSSSDPSVAEAGSDGTLTLNGVGSAMITAHIPEDDNHYGTTAVFTLYVNNENSMTASAANVSGAYNGVASYSINVTVENAPDDSTPEIRYYGVKHEAGETPVPPATEHYSEENPSFTEAGTYTVFFYVTAAGANPVQDSAQITISPRTIHGTYAENYSGEGMVSQIAAGEFIYSGGEIRPAVAVWDTISGDAEQLVEDTDYEVIYTDNVQIGTGAVTVRGIGNYDGEVKQEFSIIEVPGKQLTAELDRYYGLLDDPDTTTATVSVRHGDHSIDAEYIDISVAGPNGDDSGCTADGLELSFSVSGVYTITVEVDDGSHAGTMTLYYALMPKTSDGGFRMTLDGSSTKVVTFGQRLIAEGSGIAEQITVTDGEDSLTYGQDYTLSCVWYDYHGNQKSVELSTLTGIPQAGMYVVTAKGKGQYSGTGTFTFLVLQKNLSDGDIQWTVEGNLIYDAAAQTPQVTGGQFTDAAGTLQKVDFVVDTSVGENGYQNNINAGEGTARVAVKAPDNSNNYTGTALLPFSIGRRPITKDADFTITVPAEVHISAGGEARPEVTIYDNRLDRLLTNQDFEITYRDNSAAGTATVVIEGTGNYCTKDPIEKTFTVVVTSTTFDLAIDKTSWTYRDKKAASITVTGGGAQLDIKQGHYVLSISKGNEGPQEFNDTGAALAYLDEPGTYTVTAIGRGSYSFTDTETVVISKAQLALEITVTPNTKAGSGTATIQVTPGAGWPYASTSLRTLTVTKNGAAQDALTLEYDTTANAYQPVSFSFGNETATYRFGISTGEITDFDEDCYELAITGGLLTVVEQTNTGGGGGGGGGGTTTTYTISAEAGTGGTINPNGDVQVTRGADYTFTISASEGYAIDDVIVDGDSVGAVSRYTFENVREDHTIEAVFVRDNGVADPDETGVSNWLNTVDHFAYLSGYPGDLFGPDNNMTRAEAAQMFYNLLLDKDVPTTVTFMDVDSDTWYADAVHALASLGIINGVGDNRYEPERAITRAEFTVMATRFAHVQTAGVDTFSDVSESDWFFPYVATCVQYGWIDGYPDGTFRPDNSITRAEVTTIVNRMLGRSADSAYVDDHTGDLTQFNDVEPMRWAYYQIMEAANAHDYIKSGGMEDWTGLN